MTNVIFLPVRRRGPAARAVPRLAGVRRRSGGRRENRRWPEDRTPAVHRAARPRPFPV